MPDNLSFIPAKQLLWLQVQWMLVFLYSWLWDRLRIVMGFHSPTRDTAEQHLVPHQVWLVEKLGLMVSGYATNSAVAVLKP